MRHDFHPQDPIAFVIDLQRQFSEVDLEHHQIISRSLDPFFQPAQRSPLGMVVRTILPAKDGREGFHIQRTARPVQQFLIHLIQRRSALEQQVAAVFQLIKRILILEFRALLLIPIQRETQTRGIEPTVTNLGQPPYSVRCTQGLCDLIQGLEIGPSRKTVALLLYRQAPFTSLAFDPFMTVGNHLRPKRRIATDPNRDMSPVGIHQVNMVMIDVRPFLLAIQIRDLILAIAFDFPHRRWRASNQDQEHSFEIRVLRKIRLRLFMFPFSGLAQQKWNLVLLRIRLQPALEPSRHPFQMRTVQGFIRTHPRPPPAPETTRALRIFKIRVDHDPIHAVVMSLQQFLVIAGEVVDNAHALIDRLPATISGPPEEPGMIPCRQLQR